jgi:hypothetical protein
MSGRKVQGAIVIKTVGPHVGVELLSLVAAGKTMGMVCSLDMSL